MGFTELEAAGKKALEQFPVIKRTCKRVYQLASYGMSDEKFRFEGDVRRVTPDDGYEYFFGYYDKSPWDATDRYMIALRVCQAYKSVAPAEPGTLVLIDTHNKNAVTEVGITHSWNVQQGCMAQWLGPDFRSRIIYNDFRNGQYCSVIYDVEKQKETKVLSCPVYDVAKDGSYALSLDFSRLHRMRPGYGYSNLPDTTKGILCPDSCCIWKIDLNSGESTELFKYTDLAAFEPKESMKGAEHKVNHLMISPNGKRFMLLHRWFQNGRKNTRLVTVNIDKTEMYNLSDDVFVSHCCWKNDKEILSFLRKNETGDHYYLMKDKTMEYQMYWSELNTDGHCTYSPDCKYVITDTYPNRKRLASVYLCTEDDNCSRRIARVFAPFRYDNDCRCDLHPRWDHSGKRICIDSVHSGRRALYVIALPNSIKNEDSGVYKIPKIIHYVWFGNGQKSKVVEQSMKSWKTFLPDFEIMGWNEENFSVADANQYVQEAYREKKWAFVSDYVRLKALYDYGGIYLDTDMEILRSIDKFCKLDGFFCVESHNTICTAIIASKPHAPWIKELLDEYEHLFFINEDGSLNKLPNTKRVQAFLQSKYNYVWSDELKKYSDGLVIFPSEYFSPRNCFTGELYVTKNTYGIHHYDNTWKSKGERIKRKMMQLGTRVIGENNRAKLVQRKNNLSR